MEIDFAFLCDHADSSGKLQALGIGFDTIYSPELPYTTARFFAVMRLRFSSVETGSKDISLQVIDDHGGKIASPFAGVINVADPPAGRMDSAIALTIDVHSMSFESYGTYAVVWVCQGSELKRVPFGVATTIIP
jgi:hypothetical protein